MTAMDHVRTLAETIGPRGSTTAEEEAAARYAAGCCAMRGWSRSPSRSPAPAPVGIRMPYSLAR